MLVSLHYVKVIKFILHLAILQSSKEAMTCGALGRAIQTHLNNVSVMFHLFIPTVFIYAGTIMCCGQTGAGKTYTMTGANESYKQRGVIPRAIQQVKSDSPSKIYDDENVKGQGQGALRQ